MNTNTTTQVLRANDIELIIRKVGVDQLMDELIERTHRGFVEFNDQHQIVPIRSGFHYSAPEIGLVEWMPIRDVAREEILIKTVGYHPENPNSYELPTILSTIAVYDTRTGHLKTLLDGVIPTALRTASASAVASRFFGHPDSKVLGIIGCGAQSITQLHAISRVFDLETVLFFDIEQAAHESFESRAATLAIPASFTSATIDEIVASSDILCTATSIGVGDGPLFEYQQSKEWLHVNAVGSDFEGKFELPKALLEISYVCPDKMDQAIIEGECQQLEKDQIGEYLVACLKKEGELKHLKTQRTVFDSTGMALEDQIVTDLFLAHATALQIGDSMVIENTAVDLKNPYSFLT